MNKFSTSMTPSGFRKPALRFAKPVITEPTVGRADEPASPRLLRLLVWSYFWMLIFEGALRKWLLPQFSDPILIIRDPIAIAIIFFSYQYKLVPRQKLYSWLLGLAAAGALLLIAQFILLKTPTTVLIYGYRTAFLHLPLIFLIPRILSFRDVLHVGKWVLLLALPMAILMAWQFRSPADAWINKTAGSTGSFQIVSAFGKIRPPGTFSFITGCIAFFSLAAAFLGYGLVSRRANYPKWILAAAAIGLGLGVAVSGSRATVVSGAIVAATWIFAATAGRRLSSMAANSAIVLLVAVLVLQQVPLMQEGREVLDQRFEMGRHFEDSKGGLLGRFFGELFRPLARLPEIPIFGAGLGVGTNVGAYLQTGTMKFLLAEGEWGRVLYEAGPIFGLLFLGYRLGLAIHLGRSCVRMALQGTILPILLFSACGVAIATGQFSQPTILGFTVFAAGLCWTALRHADPEEKDEAPAASKRFKHRAYPL